MHKLQNFTNAKQQLESGTLYVPDSTARMKHVLSYQTFRPRNEVATLIHYVVVQHSSLIVFSYCSAGDDMISRGTFQQFKTLLIG